MNTGTIILGIILFALVTALLYVWGLKKSVTQPEDLQRILLGKGAARIRKYLKTHETIDLLEVARQIRDIKASMFWSRNRASIQDPAAFSRQLITFMQEQQLIEAADAKRYRLKP